MKVWRYYQVVVIFTYVFFKSGSPVAQDKQIALRTELPIHSLQSLSSLPVIKLFQH